VGSAEAFGLGQRSIHILNAYVEQHPTLVIRAAADPAGMPAPAGFSTNP
jgi:hypothetical protein